MERKSFLLYHNFYNQFDLLGMEDRGALITAIFQHAKEGKTDVKMSPLVKMAFSIIRDTLDRDAESYRKICEKNAENGKKGGRPPKKKFSDGGVALFTSVETTACEASVTEGSSFASKSERFFSKPKKADNDNDNDNDNDIDKDKDKDNDKSVSASAPSVASGSSCGSAVPQKQNAASGIQGRGLLRDDDRETLLSLGVDGDYLREREGRAIAYAMEKGRAVRDVLFEWWQGDRRRGEAFVRNPKSSGADRTLSHGHSPRGAVGSFGNSFDTDALLQAALSRDFSERKRNIEV